MYMQPKVNQKHSHIKSHGATATPAVFDVEKVALPHLRYAVIAVQVWRQAQA